MRGRGSSETKPRRSSGNSIWLYVGGIALAVAAAGVITQLHDIRRYINMRRM